MPGVPRVLGDDEKHQVADHDDVTLAARQLVAEGPLRQRGDQWCSVRARCRTSPSSDRVDGGTERRASCSGLSPSHFIRTVSR